MKHFRSLKTQYIVSLTISSFIPLVVFTIFYLKGLVPMGWILAVLPACVTTGIISFVLCLFHRGRIKGAEKELKVNISFYLSLFSMISLLIFLSVQSLSGMSSLRPGSALDAVIFVLMPAYLIPTLIIGYLAGWLIECVFARKSPLAPIDFKKYKSIKNNTPLIIVITVIVVIAAQILLQFSYVLLRHYNVIPMPHIYYAAQTGNIRQVKRFLKNGVDINQPANTDYKQAPLHQAALHGQDEIIIFLVSKGAEVDSLNALSQTPLHRAARTGYVDSVKTLVRLGANINSRDRNGNTPLREATRRGHKEIVLYLINNGADVNLENNGNQTPIFMAVLYNYPEIVNILLEHGANVDIRDKKGRTPLSAAVEKKYTSIEELLRKHGARK